jgi:hypothetical protein
MTSSANQIGLLSHVMECCAGDDRRGSNDLLRSFGFGAFTCLRPSSIIQQHPRLASPRQNIIGTPCSCDLRRDDG